MPLTPDEFKTLTKSIFYAHQFNLMGIGTVVNIETVLSLINDYSPKIKSYYKIRKDKTELCYEIEKIKDAPNG